MADSRGAQFGRNCRAVTRSEISSLLSKTGRTMSLNFEAMATVAVVIQASLLSSNICKISISADWEK